MLVFSSASTGRDYTAFLQQCLWTCTVDGPGNVQGDDGLSLIWPGVSMCPPYPVTEGNAQSLLGGGYPYHEDRFDLKPS